MELARHHNPVSPFLPAISPVQRLLCLLAAPRLCYRLHTNANANAGPIKSLNFLTSYLSLICMCLCALMLVFEPVGENKDE